MRRRRALGALALTLGALGAAACDDPQQPGPPGTPGPPAAPPATSEPFTTADGIRFQVETVAANLEVPWGLAFAPDGRLFVTERPGRVRILDLAARTSELALTLDDVFAQGEAGLLGLALDPGFAQNRLVYLWYTARAGSGAVNRLVRYREAGSRLAERSILLDGVPGAVIHDGGRLKFGPDGFLYATAGDANDASLSQAVGSTAGKILRLRPDGTTPAGNPFGSPVYSFGHRNPQGFDWHPATGDLWATEHGASGNDEINVIDPGVNYGWPVIEASQTRPDMRAPVVFFSPAIAPSGAAFSRGDRVPGFMGNLFVATLRGMHLLRLRISGRTVTSQERLLDGRYGRLRDVVSGPDGYLYVATNNRDGRGNASAEDDRILRLVPAS